MAINSGSFLWLARGITRPVNRVHYGIIALILFLAVAVFLLDFFLPLGIAVTALYSLVILLAMLANSPQLLLYTAAMCSVFLVIGFYLSSPLHVPLWIVFLNRSLFLVAIWVTAILGVRLLYFRRKLEESENNLKQTNQSLERMVHHDSLTGVTNRRFFDDALEAECERANRGETPLTLLMIDVDLFKQFNDINGHQAGDLCLQRIAWAIQDRLRRPSDIVARYGGEEFAVILPVTAEAGALERAEDVRKTVEELAILYRDEGSEKPVTVSVGVACLWPHVQWLKPENIIGKADAALYRAKKEGRNCVRMIED